MWDGFNKRKFPRINLQCEIAIASEGQKSSIRANTENVGVGGVCVILDQELERFSKCRIHLDLKGKKGIDCEAKVVWIVPTRQNKSTKKYFDTGLEFVGLPGEDLDEVKSFLEKEISKGATLAK